MNINKVTLGGRVCQTPELKALPSGISVVNFSLAINRYWKDANGNKQEAVEFVNCIFFGKSADTIAQYVVKGQGLLVFGRIQTRSWDGQDGKKMYRTEIIGEEFQFGERPKDADEKRTGAEKAQGVPAKKKTEPMGAQEAISELEYPEEEINPEDIPF
jgi:single-strand DNA-binding protein